VNRCDQADKAIAEAVADWERVERHWPAEYVDQGQREARAERWAIQDQDNERAAVPRVAGPGLVSVPTSGTQCRKPSVPFRVQADRAALLAALPVPIMERRGGLHVIAAHGGTVEGFDQDAQARRLAQLRMNVGFAARGHVVNPNKGGDDCIMVTLTYAGTNDAWSPRHVSDFIKRVRQYMARRGVGLRYVWVAELQRRGVIHYHAALFVPRGFVLPKPDDFGWWPHGFTRIELARAAVPYLLKYLSKDASKTLGDFPKGARIYGIGGLDFAGRRARRWLGLPGFVQGCGSIFADWRRRVGGGWTTPSGAVVPSEFRRVSVGGRSALVRVHRHVRTLEANGPYSGLGDRDVSLRGAL